MTRTREEIEAIVRDCIRHTLGCEDDELDLELRLVEDLGAESMDFVDIVGRIGRRLEAPLNLHELDDALKDAMSPAAFEQGLVTAPALPVLRRYFPDAADGEIYDGMPLHEVPFLFTGKMLVDFALAAHAAKT